MASLGLHFQWLIPLPTEQLSKSHTWGWTSGLARITGLLSVKVLPGHSPQWWWSGMGEISGGLWASGSLQREPQCGQMAVQDLCQEPGIPPGLLAGVECGFGCLASFPLPSLHPSLGTYSPPGLCNQLVQSPRASTHPTSGKPSFLPASLISSPPLPFNPTAVLYTHTHTHTQRDFLNLIFKTLSSSGLRFFTCK